jgi:hypothetical protein
LTTCYILRHADKERGDFFNPHLRHNRDHLSACLHGVEIDPLQSNLRVKKKSERPADLSEEDAIKKERANWNRALSFCV